MDYTKESRVKQEELKIPTRSSPANACRLIRVRKTESKSVNKRSVCLFPIVRES